jgi:hypothetical protein
VKESTGVAIVDAKAEVLRNGMMAMERKANSLGVSWR